MKRPTLEQLKPLVWEGRYTICAHAAQHAIAEGFFEQDIVAVLEHGRELAIYPEDSRMLVLGYVRVSPNIALPLHVVVEFRRSWLDVVTAFVPTEPYRVVSRERVAILVEYGPREVRERRINPKAPAKSRPRAWRLRGA